MAISSQLKRDAAGILLLVGSLVWYGHNLNWYLAEIGHPWLIVSSFWGSVCFAVWHVWQPKFPRLSIARILATCSMFAVGVIVAHYLRMQYIEMLHFVWSQPELANLVGADVVAAMRNRVVGFGGCYAMGLMMMRWIAYRRLERICIAQFVPQESMQPQCPHCGQTYCASA